VSDLDESKFWLDALKWDENGLIPAIAQEAATGRVLTLAWMNQESLRETVASGRAVYWSRSRRRLWRKGEESGHFQKIGSIRTDCDGDVLLLTVEQVGGIACHTGRESCFFRELQGERWLTVDPVLKNPKEIYKNSP
jgi:phosphoribosyl-AMP cyclohydrolase